MGAKTSSTLPEAKESSSKKPHVIAFHSSAQWKIHFEASKYSTKLMVIDFTAVWCAPCQYMASTIDEFAAKYKEVEFIKIDVDELDDVAREFEVHAMPTFILLNKGQIVDKVIGANRGELQRKIEKHSLKFITSSRRKEEHGSQHIK